MPLRSIVFILAFNVSPTIARAPGRSLLRQAGSKPGDVVGVPAPFPLAVENRRVADLHLRNNEILVKVWKQLFSYQIFMELQPPTPPSKLLEASREASIESNAHG